MKTILTEEMKVEIAILMGRKDYFGRNGSIANFKKHFLELTETHLQNGDHTLALQYLRILYNAMEDSFFDGDIFLLRALYLSQKANNLITQIKEQVGVMNDKVTPIELLFFMFVKSRSLQILKKLNLLRVMKNTELRLEKHVEDLSQIIRDKIENEYARNHGFYSSLDKPKLDDYLRIVLTADALLFELYTQKLFHSVHCFVQAEDEMMRFINKNSQSEDYKTLLFVSKLLHSIGNTDNAKYIRYRAERYK
jgi:hypothetical protein